NVEIINLGLEPQEGLDMELAVEEVTYEKVQAVADYVHPIVGLWLQKNRIELNAMMPTEFLEWLEAKFAAHSKLIPPADVMRKQLEEDVKSGLEEKITNEVLEEAGIDALVEDAFKDRIPAMDAWAKRLVTSVTDDLRRDDSQSWTASVGKIAKRIVS